MSFEARPHFRLIPTPHFGGDDARCSTFGKHRSAEMIAAIGAIGIDVTRIVGKRIRAGSSIIDIGRRHRDFFDKSRICIGANMRLVSVNRRFPAVFDPMTVSVAFTG